MAYHSVYMPEHSRADLMGHVGVHILVAEKKLGRGIRKGEIVHHLDWDKANNDPENLLVPITRARHQQIPLLQGRFLAERGLIEEFIAWMEQYGDLIVEIYAKEQALLEIEERKKRRESRLERQNGTDADSNDRSSGT